MTGALALVRRALAYELGMWHSLYRWVLRRPVGEGERFGYASAVTPVHWAFIVVSAIEIPIVHLLLPWPPVRIALLAVGVYGLLWMVGMLASFKAHPHVVDATGLHVRLGATVHLVVPWEDVASVRSRRRSYEGARSVHVQGEGGDRVLAIAIGGQTTLDVVLARPLPLVSWRGDAEPVTGVRLHADDPTALVRRLRAGIEGERVAGEGWAAR